MQIRQNKFTKRTTILLIALSVGVLFSFSMLAVAQRGERLKRLPGDGSQVSIPSGDSVGEIDVDGRKRTYIVHLPPGYKKGMRVPLVLVFHGGGGNAENMIRRTGFSEKADKENFIVVYPNGSGRRDNTLLTFDAGGCCAYAMENKIDDVGFVSKLIDRLTGEYSIDGKRVYVTGFSNGAMLSHLLAAELSDKISAAAAVSGSVFSTSPKPKGSITILMIHGKADTAVPFDGGMSKRRIIAAQSEAYTSVRETADYWAKNGGCGPRPRTTVEGKVTTAKYTGCKPNCDLEVITIDDGTHSWPGGTKGRQQADEPSTAINATDVIWNFFKQHGK